MNYGFVYCLINDCMPNLCKIGYTDTFNKTSQDRAKELSRSTSCPSDFKVVFDIKVKNPHKYEKILHNKLQHLRHNNKREFFTCSPLDIIDLFNMDNLINNDNDKTDFHFNYFNQYLNLIPDELCPKNLNNTTEQLTDIINEPMPNVLMPLNYLDISNNTQPDVKNNIDNTDNNIYKCKECLIIFKTNSGLWKHTKYKHTTIIEEKSNTMCKYCNKNFSDRIARWRHEKDYCKYNAPTEEPVNIIRQDIIHFCEPGKENLTIISPVQIETIINQTEPIKFLLVKAIELINFNENLPQNHTFCTTSLNNKYVSTLNTDTLNIEKQRKTDYFDKILLYGLSHLKTLNSMIKSRTKKKRFNDTIIEIEKYLFTNSEYKKIYIDLINVLSYNKRNLVDATWKKIINDSLIN
jgi:hypothetical protein